MKHTFRKQHFSSLSNAVCYLSSRPFYSVLCAIDDLANEQPCKHTGTTVAFTSDAQMEALAQAVKA